MAKSKAQHTIEQMARGLSLRHYPVIKHTVLIGGQEPDKVREDVFLGLKDSRLVKPFMIGDDGCKYMVYELTQEGLNQAQLPHFKGHFSNAPHMAMIQAKCARYEEALRQISMMGQESGFSSETAVRMSAMARHAINAQRRKKA